MLKLPVGVFRGGAVGGAMGGMEGTGLLPVGLGARGGGARVSTGVGTAAVTRGMAPGVGAAEAGTAGVASGVRVLAAGAAGESVEGAPLPPPVSPHRWRGK